MLSTIRQLHTSLSTGETTSRALTEAALARIDAPDGEGGQTFTRVYREQALAAAQASDTLRAAGLARSPLDGLPVSVKDLFDVTGEATLAGSVVLQGADPATQNAVIVQRLIDAGAVIVGKTNMTEFAFSGLGINPHYGTPRSPWDRKTGRIPGGSSSGAGVAVADGMSVVSIGTDTGGSVRIPSAFCGLTGFKPTARRVPSTGALPLSTSLDSIGPLSASVECCAIVDSILSGEPYREPSSPQPGQLSFAVPSSVVLEGADEQVVAAFERAIEALREQGAVVHQLDVPEFEQLAYINRQGGFVCSEAWAWHRKLLEQHADRYDPRVASRIARGKDMSAADYIDLLETRSTWIASLTHRMRQYDALLMPTSPIVAPAIATLKASDDAYFSANGLILRNPTLINFFDGCALSLPCHRDGEAPVGLMIAGPAMHDAHILNIGLATEKMLKTIRQA